MSSSNRVAHVHDDGRKLRLLSDPPAVAGSVSIDDALIEPHRKFLERPLRENPSRFTVDLGLGNRLLRLDWRRVGAGSGRVLFLEGERLQAAAVLFSGIDPDDFLAEARLLHAAGQSFPGSFINRLRESERPLVGVALSPVDAALRQRIAELAVALAQGVVLQIHPPRSGPLAAAIGQELSSRFCHLLVTPGAAKARRWAAAKALLDNLDLHQAVISFMDRLDASPEHFEHTFVLHDVGPSPVRFEWRAAGPTTGAAQMTDANQMSYALLLLSGKDSAADAAALAAFESSLPRFLRPSFVGALPEIKLASRPLLLNVAQTAPDHIDGTVLAGSEAFAAAFFQRLGAL